MNNPMTSQEKQAAYDAWFVAQVDEGIADCDADNVLSHEQAEREMDAFMVKLLKKHGQKAA